VQGPGFASYFLGRRPSGSRTVADDAAGPCSGRSAGACRLAGASHEPGQVPGSLNVGRVNVKPRTVSANFFISSW
jgi:hypothetical protein